MKEFLGSKRVLTLAMFIMIAAAIITPLSGSIVHSYAAAFADQWVWTTSSFGVVGCGNAYQTSSAAALAEFFSACPSQNPVISSYSVSNSYIPESGHVCPSGTGLGFVMTGDVQTNEVDLYCLSNVPPQPGKSIGGGYGDGNGNGNGGVCGCNGSIEPYASSVGAVKVGEPIDVGTGNVFYQYSDYTTSGANQLDFTRYYNSRASSTTFAVSLGSNWRSNYDRYLNIKSSTSAAVERADGQVLNFTLSGGVWTSDSDVDVTLIQSGNGTGSTWVLKDKNDTVETYTQLDSGEALLNSIVLRDGYTQTLTYNSSNQLTQVADSFGRKLTFTYNGNLLATLTAPDGLVITYGFNSSGINPGVNDRLASVSYSTSPATSQSYSYTQNFDLTTITDENGNTYATWTYDSSGRGLTSQLGNGALLTTIAYDDSTGNRTVTGALGQQDVYKFTTLQNVPKLTEIDRQASSNAPAATETFSYDSNGYLASNTDWNGNVTQYVNDAHGQPTSIIEASGTAQQRTTTITYDATFIHLPDQIVQPRMTTSFTYDANGNVLTRTETDTSGGSTNGQTRTWTYTHDSQGHVLTATGPRTDVTQTTTYTYSGNNIAMVTDALGHVSKITRYNASGLPLSMTDPNGVITTLTYDARDRLLASTIQAASGNATTTLGYDAAGNVTSVTLPDNSRLLYTYDSAHRVTQVKNNLNESVQYTLDASGDIIQAQILNSLGTIAKTQSAVFDTLGRMLQQIGASSQTTSFAYDSDGNTVSVTDPLGNAKTQSFDALNRLIKQADPLTNETSYVFDAQDNLTGVTDPRNLTTTYTYDGFGQVISETSPDRGTTTYTLDKAGNRVSETDARGIVVNRTFDKLNRVLTETYPASMGENVTYTYDVKSKTNFGIGSLGKIKDASGTTTFTYNERGDILTDTRIVSGKNYKTIYTYDLADHVLSITYPSGDLVTSTRDAFGRIASVDYKPFGGTATTLAQSITYEPFGPITGLVYGNALTETLTYDQDYRLTAITSGNVQNLTLAYNAADNITSITDNLDNTRNQTFGYDKDYRLLSATGKYGTVGYTYDADGNRLTITTNGVASAYTYPTSSNELTSVKTGSLTRKFTYLANGDLSKDTRSSTSTAAVFSYNDQNRNGKVTINGVATTYKQNALGERVIKTTGTAITDYQYDLNGHLIAESNGSTGTVTREYVYLNDMPLAQIESNGTIYYIHNDQTGTPQKMTSSTQAVVWDRTQQPFGQSVSITGTVIDNIRFPGQYVDSESGLSYNGNRYYDPTLGRYTQGDPIGLNGGINPYVYVGGNPVNWVDPEGLDIKVYGGGNLGLHEAFTVDTNQGTFSFGFGPKWSSFIPYGPGAIHEGNAQYSNIIGGNLITIYPLSLSDGDNLVQRLRTLEKNPPFYSVVGFNCNNFANMIASYASQGGFTLNSFSPLDFNRITH